MYACQGPGGGRGTPAASLGPGARGARSARRARVTNGGPKEGGLNIGQQEGLNM